MPEVIAQGIIEVGVDTSKTQKDMGKLKAVAQAQAGIVSKTFVTNFNVMAEAANKMAAQVTTALKMITIPAIGFGTLAVKKFLTGWSDAAIEARQKFDAFKKSFDNSMRRIGYYITQSKIFGKSMYEWMDAFSKLLERVTQRQVQKMVTLLEKALKVIMALKAATMAINFSAGFVKALEVLGKLGVAQAGAGVAQAAGAGVGAGMGVGAGAMAITQMPYWKDYSRAVTANYAKMMKEGPPKTLFGGRAILSNLQQENYRKLMEGANKHVLEATAAATSLTTKLSAFLSSIGKLVSVFAKVMGVFAIVIGFFQGISRSGKKLGFFSSLWKTIKFVFDNVTTGIEMLFESLRSLGLVIGSFASFGWGWWKNIKDTFRKIEENMHETFGEKLYKMWKPGEYKKAQEGEDIVAGIEADKALKEGEDAAKALERMTVETKALEDAIERKNEAFEYTMEHLFDNLDKQLDKMQERFDTEKIIESVEKERIDLEEKMLEVSKAALKERKKELDSIEAYRKSFSGQYLAGTDVVKFAQRVETDWTAKMLEHQRNMEELQKETTEGTLKVKEELSVLNDKFTRFLNYVEQGLPSQELATGLGL